MSTKNILISMTLSSPVTFGIALYWKV